MVARHIPVMVKEVVTALKIRPGGAYLDCTVGEGGHARAILGAVEPGPRLLGIDLDADALAVAERRLQAFDPRAVLVRRSYTEIQEVAEEYGFDPADGVLFDLGLSALQLESAERGFSFSRPGPLDMRFDVRQSLTAYDVVNRTTEKGLADIIYQYGEEPKALRLARAIVKRRPVRTTVELAEAVSGAHASSRSRVVHAATRTFQAIRIAVNGELENVRTGLRLALLLLRPGGRLAVISYHSLEDRLAKSILAREASDCICPPGTPICICGHEATIRLVERKVKKPSEEEIRGNPRSRSARLRVAEKL